MHAKSQTMPFVTAYSRTLEETTMDDTDFIEEPAVEQGMRADEKMRLKLAFGDDVAQRFLRLRGIVGDLMQEAVLERSAARQAARLARDAIATAAMPVAEWTSCP
jgi:hypothetical protein